MRILLLANFARDSAATIIDHATSLVDLSRHNIEMYDPVGRRAPHWLDLDCFDAVVIHYSVYLLGDAYLDETWRTRLVETRALKVLFLQDEYRNVYAFHERIRALEVSLLFTCVPDGEIEKVYPKRLLPRLKCIQVLTGYVPDYLQGTRPRFDTPRPFDVVYRGRGGLPWLGSLFREKQLIAEGFASRTSGLGLTVDISTREADRVYGEAWLAFLRSARYTLGTESGASVFDFHGNIERDVRAFQDEHPDAGYVEIHERFLAAHEGIVSLNQISPRIFEGIACGCGLILFEGAYSGIIEPWAHFLPLKKDFSNLPEILDHVRDPLKTRDLAERAWNHVIGSGMNTYRRLVGVFDLAIEETCRSPEATRRVRPPGKRPDLPLLLKGAPPGLIIVCWPFLGAYRAALAALSAGLARLRFLVARLHRWTLRHPRMVAAELRCFLGAMTTWRRNYIPTDPDSPSSRPHPKGRSDSPLVHLTVPAASAIVQDRVSNSGAVG